MLPPARSCRSGHKPTSAEPAGSLCHGSRCRRICRGRRVKFCRSRKLAWTVAVHCELRGSFGPYLLNLQVQYIVPSIPTIKTVNQTNARTKLVWRTGWLLVRIAGRLSRSPRSATVCPTSIFPTSLISHQKVLNANVHIARPSSNTKHTSFPIGITLRDFLVKVKSGRTKGEHVRVDSGNTQC